MDLWLQNYAYRIDPDPVVFAISVISILGVLMVSILLQIMKADKQNPVIL